MPSAQMINCVRCSKTLLHNHYWDHLENCSGPGGFWSFYCTEIQLEGMALKNENNKLIKTINFVISGYCLITQVDV